MIWIAEGNELALIVVTALSLGANVFLAVRLKHYYQGLCYARKMAVLTDLLRNADVESEASGWHTKLRRLAAGKQRRKKSYFGYR